MKLQAVDFTLLCLKKYPDGALISTGLTEFGATSNTSFLLHFLNNEMSRVENINDFSDGGTTLILFFNGTIGLSRVNDISL